MPPLMSQARFNLVNMMHLRDSAIYKTRVCLVIPVVAFFLIELIIPDSREYGQWTATAWFDVPETWLPRYLLMSKLHGSG